MQASKKIIINMLLVSIFSFSFGTTFLFADEVSEKVAFEVAKQAVIDGVAEELSDEEISERIKNIQWEPQYYEYRWVSE